MPKFFKAPTGTQDLLPRYHDYFTFLKKVIRHRFRQSGYSRITPPVFEEVGAYERSLGVDSDLFTRELYAFEDRQGRKLALRPEMTTGIVRSFIEHEMYNGPLPAELYFIEPCFRFGRPTGGNMRQFWEFGAEVLGESDPSIDAQLIYLSHRILTDLQIRDKCELRINTMGSKEDRKQFFEAIANFYAGKERSLSETTQEKLKQKKYAEVLQPRNEDEEILRDMAPRITDFLSKSSKVFFDQVIDYTKSFDIDFVIDDKMTHKIKYHSNTIFEFRAKDSGQKILVGGRYDDLIEEMGGPKVGGVGFAAGINRLIDLMMRNGIAVPHKDYIQIFLAATGPVAKKKALPILVQLREHGFHAVGVLGKTSMQEQLKRAEEFNVPCTLLIGDLEVKKGEIIVRDMESRKQHWIPQQDVIKEMEKVLGKPQKLTHNVEKLDTTVDFLSY
ncbi:MAG TPA: histidine--tRNA ligase [Candidatus Gracilibacteria bacterium]